MIRIEHISFEFAAADERFVHDLYADWGGFCRNYFEKTVDECLSPLDKDKVLHEIELLELDLGLESTQSSPSIWALEITGKRIRLQRRDLCLP